MLSMEEKRQTLMIDESVLETSNYNDGVSCCVLRIARPNYE